MVSARTGMAGREGRIRLEAGRLVFTPASTSFGETELGVSEIKRAHRIRGSPVLELALAKPGFPDLVGFYFVKPPDLREEEGRSPLSFLNRRRAKKLSLNTLRMVNAAKRDEIKWWVEAIEAAREGSAPS